MAVSDSDETNSQGTLANSSEYGGIDSGELKNVAAPPEATCAGLGGVVGRFVEDAGNQIFVANDLYPNQLWNYRSEDQQWLDHAMMRGCGHGFNGGSTAFTGVAVGDLNGNGMLEFRVTNFRNESVTLFVNQQGFFRDRNSQFALSRPSTWFGASDPQLPQQWHLGSCGCQRSYRKSYRLECPILQPAQLFQNAGDRVELMEVADTSGHWKRDHVGRALAKLDFDHDGKQDVVVTHIGESSALLLNRTDSAALVST